MFRFWTLIEKHGDPNRPGYRILHPGRGRGESHRPQSRGISQQFGRARNVNLLPRPESGMGKPGQPGKFKRFMVPQAERRHRTGDRAVERQVIAERLPGAGPMTQGEAALADLEGRTVAGRGQRGQPKVETTAGDFMSAPQVAQAAAIGGQAKPAAKVPKQTGGSGAQGNPQRIFVVDVDPNGFGDDNALKAWVDREIRPGDRVIMEDHQGNRRLQQMVRAKGGRPVMDKVEPLRADRINRRLNRLDAFEQMLRDNNAEGNVVVFRDPGRTLPGDEDIAALHVRRGTDRLGEKREAVVVNPGFRGATEDENFFGVGSPELREAGLNTATLQAGGPPRRAAAAPAAPQAPAAPGATASDHLKSGGAIETAPHDGLVDAIRSQKDRFDLQRISNRNVSPTYIVTDKKQQPPKKYFIKKSASGEGWGPGFMEGDIQNEVMAGAIMEAVNGPGPGAQFGVDPGGTDGKNHWVIMQHVEEKHPGFTPTSHDHLGDYSQFANFYRNLDNPEDMVLTHMFDYLINQQDRHPGNWMTVRNADGDLRYVPVDNGGAFFAYGNTDPNLKYTEYARGGKPSITPRIYREMRRGDAEQQVDAAMAKLESVDIRGIMDGIAAKYPSMTRKQRDLMKQAADMWEWRLRDMKRNRASLVANLGG